MLCGSISHADEVVTPVAVKVGIYNARFTNGELFLTYKDVPIFKGGVIQAFYDDGRQEDYGSSGNPPMSTLRLETDGSLICVAKFIDRGKAGEFTAEQTITIRPSGDIHFNLQARWSGSKPAKLEWNPVRLWGSPLIGGSFAAITALGPYAGKIGRIAAADRYPQSILCPAWKSLQLHSPGLGSFEFTTSDPEGKIIFDARNDQFLAAQKIFWIGGTNSEVSSDHEVVRDIQFRFTPIPGASLQTSGNQNIVLKSSNIHNTKAPAQLYKDQNVLPNVIPQPKSITISSNGPFHLPQKLTLYLDSQAMHSVEIMLACKEFGEWLELKTGNRSRIAISPECAADAHGVHLRVSGGEHAEGYRLTVSQKMVVIMGTDLHGLFYGLQTLEQLVTSAPHRQYEVAGTVIDDWPSIAFRGAHIFVGKDALPFHRNLIRNIFSYYKLNAMVIECEDTKWKSHPELWRENSISTDDLQRIVDLARSHFLEPIPLINTLGHSEWIFRTGVHTDLAEDPASPHNYDPSNPDTYKLVFGVFSDALQVFGNPHYFHIGHDEVKVPSYDKIGKYPARPANIALGKEHLFLMDVNRLADWLTARGAVPMMWGDMLLNRTEGAPFPGVTEMTAAFAMSPESAALMRAGVPKNAIICDWRYEPKFEQRNGLALFEGAGHKAIGSAWFQPVNIRGWAQQVETNHAFGTLQTTWAGYDINESILETEFKQFSAYILAADNAWTGGKTNSVPQGLSPTDLGSNAASIFRAQYRGSQFDTTHRNGWYADLSSIANVNLFERGNENVPWSAFSLNLENFDRSADTETTTLNVSADGLDLAGIRLLGEHPAGVMLAGEINPRSLPVGYGEPIAVNYPKSIQLEIGKNATVVDFVQSAGYVTEDGTRIATYQIKYENGSTIDIPIQYGYQNRAFIDSSGTGFSAAPATVRSAGSVTLRRFRWVNPQPKQRIISITFNTDHPYAAPVLFAVCGYR